MSENKFISAADEVGISQQQGDYVIKAVKAVLRYHGMTPSLVNNLRMSIFSNYVLGSLYYALVVIPPKGVEEFRCNIEFPVTDAQLLSINNELATWLRVLGYTKQENSNE